MKLLIERLKNEPALIGTGITILMNLAAAFGLELEPEQRNAILATVPLILGLGFGIRSQVTPVRKIRERESGRLRPFRGGGL